MKVQYRSLLFYIIKLEEIFTDGVSEYDNNVSDHRPLYLKFTP